MSVSLGKRNAALYGSGIVLGILSPSVFADYALNFQPPVTEVASTIHDLHMLIFLICVGIAAGVFGVMIYSIINHRKSKGVQAAQFHESTVIEIIWTVVPFVILIVMAVPATKALLKMSDTSNPDMTIKITGSQFKWQYDYQKEGISFVSALATPDAQVYENKGRAENQHYLLEVDNHVVVPVDTRIRLLLTAVDVIHSWWIPAFAVKKDAIPGFVNDSWFKVDTDKLTQVDQEKLKKGEPVLFRGQCTELCGPKHGFMPIVIEVKSKENYLKWVADKQAAQAAEKAAAESGKEFSKEELMARGEKAYNATCAGCHQSNGMGIPPAFPALKGSVVVKGPVDQHIQLVLKGKNAMPPQATLSDLDLAAIITYERNAWDNNTGDVVQSAKVKSLR
jgi:cytochrome c oxidase subunit 2